MDNSTKIELWTVIKEHAMSINGYKTLQLLSTTFGAGYTYERVVLAKHQGTVSVSSIRQGVLSRVRDRNQQAHEAFSAEVADWRLSMDESSDVFNFLMANDSELRVLFGF